MAKSNSTRRKARKSKFIEIQGHRLTPAMHADYQRCVEQRKLRNEKALPTQIEDMALADFLHGYRPSHKIKDQLWHLSSQASTVAVAIGTMRDYLWVQINPGAIRKAGVDFVGKIALELNNASAKLMVIADNVEVEKQTKLQDWLAWEDQMARAEKAAGVF